MIVPVVNSHCRWHAIANPVVAMTCVLVHWLYLKQQQLFVGSTICVWHRKVLDYWCSVNVQHYTDISVECQIPERNCWNIIIVFVTSLSVSGDNCSYKSCKAALKSSPQTNQHPVFLQDGCPSCRPTNNVKALTCSTQAHWGASNFVSDH